MIKKAQFMTKATLLKAAVIVLLFAFSLATVSVQVEAQTPSNSTDLEIVATLSVSNSTSCIAVNNQTNQIYIGDEEGLTIIDGATDTVITQIPLDDEVTDVEVNPLTNRVYALVYGKSIVVIDGATNSKVGEIPEKIFSSFDQILAVNPVTNLVYVAVRTVTMNEYDCVKAYTGDTLQLEATINIPYSNEHQYIEQVNIAVNTETNTIYATWTGDDSINLISGTSNTVTKTVQPSDFSQNVQVNPTTDFVYVGTVVLDGENLSEVTQNYTGTLQAIDPEHNLLFTMKSKMLYALNGTTHSVIDNLEMNSWSYDFAAVNPNTSKLYLGNSYDSEIVVVSYNSPP